MKNILLAIISGLLFWMSWPTGGYAWLLFIAFIPLLLAIENICKKKVKSGVKVFVLSFITFAIWNFGTTWWLHYADFYAALFAAIANSILMATVIRIYYYVRRIKGHHFAIFFLPAVWIAFEKLHLNWDISWPWLNLGNGFAEYYTWVQWYEYTGVFGGTLWVLVVNLVIFSGVVRYVKFWYPSQLFPNLIMAAFLIFIPFGISKYMYSSYIEKGEKTNIVVLQPNLDPYKDKFNSDNVKLSSQLTQLAERKVTKNTSFVFGPETSLPNVVYIDRIGKYNEIKNIEKFISNHNKVSFVSGVTLVKQYDKKNISETANYSKNGKIWYDIYNSAFMVDASKKIQIYHKSKLVVGVEHMPFRSFMKPLLGDLIIDLGGTSGSNATQKHRSVFINKHYGVTAAPIICYESVYGEFVTEYVRKGANILSVITNDGWWENTEGHKQHLSFSRLRAIENRRSVARSANTGVSAFINQRGDIIKSLDYGVEGVISSDLKLNTEKTIYTLYGDSIARVAIFVVIFALLGTITDRENSYTN